jgi:hypothetical protein
MEPLKSLRVILTSAQKYWHITRDLCTDEAVFTIPKTFESPYFFCPNQIFGKYNKTLFYFDLIRFNKLDRVECSEFEITFCVL